MHTRNFDYLCLTIDEKVPDQFLYVVLFLAFCAPSYSTVDLEIFV